MVGVGKGSQIVQIGGKHATHPRQKITVQHNAKIALLLLLKITRWKNLIALCSARETKPEQKLLQSVKINCFYFSKRCPSLLMTIKTFQALIL